MIAIGIFLHAQLLVNLFVVGKQLYDHDTDYIIGTMMLTFANVLTVIVWSGIHFP